MTSSSASRPPRRTSAASAGVAAASNVNAAIQEFFRCVGAPQAAGDPDVFGSQWTAGKVQENRSSTTAGPEPLRSSSKTW